MNRTKLEYWQKVPLWEQRKVLIHARYLRPKDALKMTRAQITPWFKEWQAEMSSINPHWN